MVVYFDIVKIPRTTTKKEWYLNYRKFRIMRREQQDNVDVMLELLPLMTPEQKAKTLDDLTFPPVLLGPFMELKG